MPVEISILSGARQGDVIQLPDAGFEVGSLASDAVGFDPHADGFVRLALSEPEQRLRTAAIRIEQALKVEA